jgi:hypothetical protein
MIMNTFLMTFDAENSAEIVGCPIAWIVAFYVRLHVGRNSFSKENKTRHMN